MTSRMPSRHLAERDCGTGLSDLESTRRQFGLLGGRHSRGGVELKMRAQYSATCRTVAERVLLSSSPGLKIKTSRKRTSLLPSAEPGPGGAQANIMLRCRASLLPHVCSLPSSPSPRNSLVAVRGEGLLPHPQAMLHALQVSYQLRCEKC